MDKTVGSIGEPDIKLGAFSLWVFRREFPDSNDYWDGNWLHARATVEASGSCVEVSGPWLRTDKLRQFHDGLVAIDRTCMALPSSRASSLL